MSKTTTTLNLILEDNQTEVLESVLSTAHTSIELQLAMIQQEIAKTVAPVLEGGSNASSEERANLASYSAYLFEQKVLIAQILGELDKAKETTEEKPLIVQPNVQKAKKLIVE